MTVNSKKGTSQVEAERESLTSSPEHGGLLCVWMMSWDNRIISTGEEAPDQLLANPMNWRIHPEFQQKALKGVLDQVGWVQQVIVNQRTGHLIDGHLRVTLAMREGVGTIPVNYVDLSEDEEKLILATLDPLAGLAVTDDEMYGSLTEGLEIDDAAVAELIGDIGSGSPLDGLTDPDEIPEVEDDQITKTGDLIVLGDHRLLCGDAMNREDIDRLMDGQKADIVFTDPPFEMESTDYMRHCLEFSTGAVLVMHSDKNMVKLAQEYVDEFRYFLIHYYSFGFVRSNNMPQIAHHLIGVFGTPSFRSQRDGFKTVIAEQMERGKLMPYQKRVAIPEQCISHYSEGAVLDVFAGSGSTLIACELQGRNCFTMEKDPHYCDIIISRPVGNIYWGHRY